MGVSGSGKSTIARALADSCNLEFVEADDFHSMQAREMMSNGIALNDDIRRPWVDEICAFVSNLVAKNTSVVIAYSGLKAYHRDIFRQIDAQVQFVYLKLPQKIIEKRLSMRKQHFFNPKLVRDQFMQMQEPVNEADVFFINGQATQKQIIEKLQTEFFTI